MVVINFEGSKLDLIFTKKKFNFFLLNEHVLKIYSEFSFM